MADEPNINTNEENAGAEQGGAEQGGAEQKETRTFTQEEVNALIDRKFAQWQKKAEKQTKKETPEEGGADTDTQEKIRAAETKAEMLEARVLCLEAGVSKDAADDVIALARNYISDEIDMEDAIGKVLEKYPSFAAKADTESKAAWGARQGGTPPKTDGVEDFFLKKNPNLKI